MSTYSPHRQGRKHAREGSPRYQHKSALKQETYDRAYNEVLAKIEAAETRRKNAPQREFTELEREMLGLLEEVLATLDSWSDVVGAVSLRKDISKTIAKAKGET